MFPFGKTCAVILLGFHILTKAWTIDPHAGSSPTTTITRVATIPHNNTKETDSENSDQTKNSKFKYYTSELLPSESSHSTSTHHSNDNRDDNIVQQKLVDFEDDTPVKQEHRSTDSYDHQTGNRKQTRNPLANILPPNILPSCSAANIDLLRDVVQQKEGPYFGEFSQQQLQQYLSMGQKNRNPISSHFAKRKAALLQGNRPGKQLVGTHTMGHYYPFYSQKQTTPPSSSSLESPTVGSRRRLQNHALYNPFKVHPLLMNPFFNPFMPFPVRTHMHPLLLHPLSYQRYHNYASSFPRLHSKFQNDGHPFEQQRKQTWDTGSTKGSPNDVRPYQQQEQTKGGKVKRKFDPRKFNSSNSNSNNKNMTSDSFSSLYNLTPEQIVRLRERLDELKVPKYSRPTAKASGSKEKQSFIRENAFTDASALTRGSDRTVSWSSV